MKVEYVSHMGDDLFIANNFNEDCLIAWAAGILEGEGCFSVHQRKRGRREGSKEVAIHCEMTDEDTILKLQNVLGVGSVCYRENKRKDGAIRKPSWILSIQKNSDIFSTIQKITPYMSNRRLGKMKEITDLLIDKFC